jgi:hypothetical protein
MPSVPATLYFSCTRAHRLHRAMSNQPPIVMQRQRMVLDFQVVVHILYRDRRALSTASKISGVMPRRCIGKRRRRIDCRPLIRGYIGKSWRFDRDESRASHGFGGKTELLRRWRSFWRKRQNRYRRSLRRGRRTRLSVKQFYVENQSRIGADFTRGAFAICKIRRNEHLIF